VCTATAGHALGESGPTQATATAAVALGREEEPVGTTGSTLEYSQLCQLDAGVAWLATKLTLLPGKHQESAAFALRGYGVPWEAG
jgi:hypothetical protein